MSILFHVFIISPITHWILKRYTRKGIPIAAGFLAIVAAVSVGYVLLEQPPNYYTVLDTDISASHSTIKRSYNRLSLMFHPDKNPDPKAQIMFHLITKAFHTLKNPLSRDLYDRFGAHFVEIDKNLSSNDNKDESSETLERWLREGMAFLSFYLIWSILSYILTMGGGSESGRMWSFVGLLLLFAIEFNMKFGNMNPFSSLFLRITIFEKIEILHQLFPAFVNGCVVLSKATTIDRHAEYRMILTAIYNSNIATLQRVELLVRKFADNSNINTTRDDERDEDKPQMSPIIDKDANSPLPSPIQPQEQSNWSRFKPMIFLFLFYMGMDYISKR